MSCSFYFLTPLAKISGPPMTTMAKVRGSLLTPLHKIKGQPLTLLSKVRGSLLTPLHKVRGPPLTPMAKVRGPLLKLSAAAWCFWLQNKEKPMKEKQRSRTLTLPKSLPTDELKRLDSITEAKRSIKWAHTARHKLQFPFCLIWLNDAAFRLIFSKLLQPWNWKRVVKLTWKWKANEAYHLFCVAENSLITV